MAREAQDNREAQHEQYSLPVDNRPAPSNINPSPSGSQLSTGDFASQNFRKGSKGWRLTAEGDLEANDGTFRGDLEANSISIPDTVTASSFHTDSDGNSWWGATTLGAAVAKILKTGIATFTSIFITGGQISNASFNSIPNDSNTDISLLSYTHDLVHSVTDLDTIAWAAGTITMSNGRTFAISAGNTGNMAARTYIYLDTAASLTVLQVTTTASTAMGANKILIAVAQNGAAQATFQVYGGLGGLRIGASSMNISAHNWDFAGAWSVTDLDTVAWGAANLVTSDGSTYAIAGGNTGNMAAKTYIYFDLSVSSTAFQTTTTAANAVGDGKILIAIAKNGTVEASYLVLNDSQSNIDAAQIVAGSITANEIAAGAVTAAKITVSTLSAIVADLGTITAGVIGAGTATIGGFAIGADYIKDAADSFGLASTVSGDDDVRFWAGSTFANRFAALFNVKESGAVTAASAQIIGTLTLSRPFQLAAYLVAALPAVVTATTSADDNAVGTIAWTTPNNARSYTGFSTAASDTSGVSVQTHYLKIYGFGYAVPSTATILGIEVEIIKNAATATACVDTVVKLIKASGALGTDNKADTVTAWPGAQNRVITYGSPTDLWGDTWTPSDVNNSNFGAALSATSTNTGIGPPNVYAIRVNVYYTGANTTPVKQGSVAYAVNARKNGEGANLGTGVMAFHDGRAWKACDTGATLTT